MIVRAAVLVAGVGCLFVGLYHTLVPARYEALARVKLEEVRPDWDTNYNPYLLQDEIALIRSEPVLGNVRERFHLRRNWGEPRKAGYLRSPGLAELDVVPVRCTRLVDIKTSAAGQQEAAGIANAIVDAWQKEHPARGYTEAARISVQLIDMAVPPPRAAFPNRYLGGASLLLGGLLILVWRFAGTAKITPASH